MSRVNGEVHEKILHRFGSVLSVISAGACTRSFTAITIARSCMSSSISGGLIVFSFISFNFEVKAAIPLCLHLIGKTLPQPAVFLARRLFGVEYFCNLLRTACFEEVFNRQILRGLRFRMKKDTGKRSRRYIPYMIIEPFKIVVVSHQPIVPSSSIEIRLFSSTAYSSGSSLEIGSTKPLIIKDLAVASSRPRCIR